MLAKLSKRITFSRERRLPAGAGWTADADAEVLATVWCGPFPASARERERMGQLGQDVTHIIMIRPLSGLTTDHTGFIGPDRYELRGIVRGRRPGDMWRLEAVEGKR